MKIGKVLGRSLPGFLLMATMVPMAASAAPTLVGTWTLVAADVQHPDGSRGRDYGADPKGLLVIDGQGHYSLQIFKSEREAFGSGDKAAGSPEEYRGAVLGSSTHFGTVSIDQTAGTLTFHIENASFPNWIGQQQVRKYELNGNELSYRVTARPNGDVPISVWKRLE
jgi:hypothetical protein